MRVQQRIVLIVVLVFGLLFSAAGIALAQSSGSAPLLKAKRAYMIEAETGTVLLAQNENDPFPPASLAKMMTMEVVFDALRKREIGLDTSFPVSEYAWRTGGAPSRTTTMFAALKSQIPVGDLIKGVTVQNANDACIILAEGMEGSEQKFAERMTTRASQLGLSQSVFANSTGLPSGESKTTARELVMLSRHIHQSYPDFFAYYSLPDFEWNRIFQRNKNPLLALPLGVDGFGAGFAEGAGFAAVATVERNGTRLFLALSGLESDKDRTEEARRLLEWGLSSFESRRLFDADESVGSASVYGGTDSHVELVVKSPVDVFVPINNPERLTARIVYKWPVRAPVEPGSNIGSLKVFAGDKLLREVPLYTAEKVEKGTLRAQAADALMELMFFWL